MFESEKMAQEGLTVYFGDGDILGGNHHSDSFDRVVKVIWNRAAHWKQMLHLKLRIFW